MWVQIYNLNWRLSRGKASVELCERANDVVGACQDLGSVKRGPSSIYWVEPFRFMVPTADNGIQVFRWKRTFREYGKRYQLTLEAGKAYQVRVKHKLECRTSSSDLSCEEEPAIEVVFERASAGGS